MATLLLDLQGHDAYKPASAYWLSSDEMRQDAFITQWQALASKACEPNPFSESWFLIAALSQFDPNHDVRIFTLWDGAPFNSELIALMPVATALHYGRWPIPHSQNWLHPNSFLGIPLFRAGAEKQCWAALLHALDRETGHAIFFHINGLTIGGPLQRTLQQLCDDQGRALALVDCQQRAFLESNLAPDAYYEAAVRSKKRKELRRQRNRLTEIGDLRFNRCDGTTGLDEWIDAFLALERSGWKGQSGSALDCAPQTRTLFHNALCGAAALGRLELLDLRLDGRPIAMLVNFLTRPGSFSFKTAFDEEYARFSPGVLLQIENLDLLQTDGVEWCDSCAAPDHPMIDSIWTGRRRIGRYSIAIGGAGRRGLFAILLRTELARMNRRRRIDRMPNVGELQ